MMRRRRGGSLSMKVGSKEDGGDGGKCRYGLQVL